MKLGDKPPIALFAYNRPLHLRRTVEALLDNAGVAEHDLYAFSDGPKGKRDAVAVAEVRGVLAGIAGFRSRTIVERRRNRGLAASIIAGVTEVVSSHGRVIVLEDDLVTSRFFLRYMTEGLTVYAGDPSVASIHGYFYPVTIDLPDTFFLKGADCWGWATWRRAWERFEPDGGESLAELRRRGLEDAFDLGGARRLVRMLRDQVAGRNDSWAIRWHASAFLGDMYTLYPGRSLVDNIGADASGTHTGTTDAFRVEVSASPIPVTRIPPVERPEIVAAVQDFFRQSRTPLLRKVLAAARRLASRGQQSL